MQKLLIEATDETPSVSFDIEANELEIKGACYPENTVAFFEPIYKWFQEFAEKHPGKSANLNVNLVYFNTASSKCLLDLFDLLGEKIGDSVNVNWVYLEGDEDMRSAGEDYSKLSKVKFDLTEVENEDEFEDEELY